MKIPFSATSKLLFLPRWTISDLLASLGRNAPDALCRRWLRVENVTAIWRDDRLVAAPTRHLNRSSAGRWDLPDLPVSRSLAIGSKEDPPVIERPTRPNVVERVGSQRFDGTAVGGHDIEIPVARAVSVASNAIRLPSALQLGLPTRQPSKFVSCVCWDPSRFDTQSSLLPDLRETNAIRVPSGENRMSKSRDVDSMTRNVASPEGWRFGEDGVGSSQMSPAMSEF